MRVINSPKSATSALKGSDGYISLDLICQCNQRGLANLINRSNKWDYRDIDYFNLHLFRDTLFSLEENDCRIRFDDNDISRLFYSLGANIYSTTISNGYRREILPLAYTWNPGSFQRLSARQRADIVTMLLIFKRFGVPVDLNLKIRFVRSFLCADFCYQKHAYTFSRLTREELKAEYMSIIDQNISSPHIKSSRAHQEYCVSHYLAEQDVFCSMTICDTSHDPQASSMAVRVRSAYINKDYGMLNNLFGFIQNDDDDFVSSIEFFYNNLFQKKQTARLYEYCGKAIGNLLDEIPVYCLARLKPFDIEPIQFIIDMTRFSGNWHELSTRFRAYKLWDDWSEQYAMAVGKQWTSLVYQKLEKIWFNWTPDSLQTYTFDFIYRARPLLQEKSPFPRPIAQLIVHWLAAATYIDKTKEYNGWTKAKMAEELAKYNQRLKSQGAIQMQMAFAERMKLIRLLKL